MQVKRLAMQLKDENVESEYLDRLRGEPIVTANSLIEGLELELKGEIAMALKRSEDKVLWALLKCDLIRKTTKKIQQDDIDAYIYWRQEAETARRNLIIHRQACGFRLNNYSTIVDMYPLPRKDLAAARKEFTDSAVAGKKTREKSCGDQSGRDWAEKMRSFVANSR